MLKVGPGLSRFICVNPLGPHRCGCVSMGAGQVCPLAAVGDRAMWWRWTMACRSAKKLRLTIPIGWPCSMGPSCWPVGYRRWSTLSATPRNTMITTRSTSMYHPDLPDKPPSVVSKISKPLARCVSSHLPEWKCVRSMMPTIAAMSFIGTGRKVARKLLCHDLSVERWLSVCTTVLVGYKVVGKTSGKERIRLWPIGHVQSLEREYFSGWIGRLPLLFVSLRMF